MSRFIEKKNHLSHHIKNVVEIAEERKSIFLEEFELQMNEQVKVVNSPSRSLNILTRIPDRISDKEITNHFTKNNVIAHHLSKCYINEKKQGLIFEYSCIRKPHIKKSLEKLLIFTIKCKLKSNLHPHLFCTSTPGCFANVVFLFLNTLTIWKNLTNCTGDVGLL